MFSTLTYMNIKRFLPVFAATLLVAVSSASCSKDDVISVGKMSFSQSSIVLFCGESAQLSVIYKEFNGNFYETSDYDLVKNPKGATLKSSDESVATVSADGVVTAGKKAGSATITLSCPKIDSAVIRVDVKEDESTKTYTFNQDLGQPLTKDMIVLPVGIVHATMQGLDIDKYGNFYIAWEETENMKVRKFTPDGEAVGADMVLPVSGHGDGFSIEQDGDACYFWTTGSLGEPNGGYSGSTPNDNAVRLICRFKFEPGTTKYTEDAEELFYINEKGCRISDIDTEHGRLACWGRDNSEFVKVYDTADIRKGGKKTFTVTRTQKHANTVVAYNLNDVKELGTIRWNRNVVCGNSAEHGMYAVQGFCVYDDKVYVEAGFKDEAYATISVLDFNGNVLQTRTPVGVSRDKQALIKFDVSSNGTFEPEGIHIRKGEMYLGFVGDYSVANAKKHACIIKLK